MRHFKRKYFCLLLFLIATQCLWAQKVPKISFDGRVSDQFSNQPLGSVTITVLKNGSVVETKSTNSNGKYKLGPFDLGANYTIKFSAAGYISKYIEVNVTEYNAQEAYEKYDIPFDITIFKSVPNIDFSLLNNKPIAILKYNNKTSEVDWDMKHTGAVKAELDKLLKKAEEEKKKAEEEAKKEAERLAAEEKQFNDAINAGNTAMTKTDYATAVTKYEEATKIRPNDATAKSKLEEAKKKLEEQKANADKDKLYSEYIKNAEKAYKEGDLGYAKSQYQEAQKIKPNEPVPPAKIKEIDALILANQEKEKKYSEFLANGDKAMLNKQYDDAIKNFEEALKIKPNEQTPKDKLAEAKKKKADAEKEAADKLAKEKQFAELVKKGDEAALSKKFDEAIANYEAALAIKDDAPVKAKLEKAKKDKETAEKEAADKLAKEKQFAELVKKGDDAHLEKKYTDAISNFEAALKIKDDAAVKSKLEKAKKDKEAADKEQADKAAKEKQFNDLVAKGDAATIAKKYDEAIANYENALKIKEDEDVKIKLNKVKEEINKLADAKKEEERKQKEYEELIKKADNELNNKEYDKSISTYEAALVIKPNEKYPKDQIAKAKQLKADAEKLAKEEEARQKKEQEYNELIAKADNDFNSNNYENSIKNYEAALKIKPTEKYPAEQILKAKQKINELAANAEKERKEKEYNELIAKADTDFNSNNYENSIKNYEAALKIKPTEKYPAEQIVKAKAEIQKLALDKQKQAELEQKYKEVIAKADNEFNAGSFKNAIALYEEALTYKANDKYASDRLELAKKRREEQLKEIEKNFNNAVAQADKKFDSEQYEEAKSAYEAIINLYGKAFDITHPKNRITEINDILKKKKEEELNAVAKEKKYKEALAKADAAFIAKKYDEAITGYEEALTYKDDSYPKNQIELSKQKKKELEDSIAEKERKEKEFKELVENGNKALSSANYDEAINNYELALKIKDDKPVKDNLAKAKQLKAEAEKNAQAQLEKEKKEKEYNELIAKANNEFEATRFNESIPLYEAALKIKPTEKYPAEQIAKAKQKIAEQNALAEKERKEKEYNKLIAKADTDFNSNNYENSIKNYEAALKIKPTEKYPAEQIAKAKAEIQKMALDKQKQTELEQKYKEVIAKADNEYNAGTFKNAITLYEEALSYKPNDKYATERLELSKQKRDYQIKKIEEDWKKTIEFADNEFNAENYADAKNYYERAINLYKSFDNTHAQNRLKEIETLLKNKADYAEKKKQYDALITKGNSELNKNEFDKAIASYEAALIIFPNETLPKEKIEEAKRLKDEFAKNQNAEKRYKEIIEKADANYNAGSFTASILQYEEALSVKPGDKYATEKIAKAKAELAKKLDMLKNQYNQVIHFADKAFINKEWDDAENYYKRAISGLFDPIKNEIDLNYPQEQLAKIQKAREEEGKNALLNNNYNEIIKKANAKFDTKEYTNARSFYVKALELKPGSKFPQDRIDEIDRILAEEKKLAEEKRQKELAEKMRNSKEPYYGEKVDITVDEALKNIQMTNFNSEYNKGDTYAELKAQKEEDERKRSQKQTDKTQDNYKKFDEQEVEMSKINDKGEQIRISNVEKAKNREAEIEKEYNAYSQKYDNENYNEFVKNSNQKAEFESRFAANDKERLDNEQRLNANQQQRIEAEEKRSADFTQQNYQKNQNMIADKVQKEERFAANDKERLDNEQRLNTNQQQRIEAEEKRSADFTQQNYQKNQNMIADKVQKEERFAANDKERIDNLTRISDLKQQRIEAEEKRSADFTQQNYQKNQNMIADKVQKEERFAANDKERLDNEQRLNTNQQQRIEAEEKRSADFTQQNYRKNQELINQKTKEEQRFANNDNERIENINAVNKQTNERALTEQKLAEKGEKTQQNNTKKFERIAATSHHHPYKGRFEELSLKYKHGVTEEIYQKKNSKGDVIEYTVRRIVLNEDEKYAYEYRMVMTRQYILYYKEGKQISENEWNTGTTKFSKD
jgi:tetratricopeptide (TPR) repeat protein